MKKARLHSPHGDQWIAALVWRRLRRGRVFVHRALVRLIIRHAFDAVTEKSPLVLERWLRKYRHGDVRARRLKRERLTEIVATAYTRDAQELRTAAIIEQARSAVMRAHAPPRVSVRQYAAMLELREVCMDPDMCAALDALIPWARMWITRIPVRSAIATSGVGAVDAAERPP